MGLDLYIEARIREKSTKRIISYNEFEKGFFKICWWFGWDFCDIRTKMIDICNKHAGTKYTDSDLVIPIPQSVLREIYECIVNRAYLADTEYFEVLPCNIEWEERSVYEKMNLVNADKLHDLLYDLNSINYLNSIHIHTYKNYIPNENDSKLFEQNPQAYEWEFRIFNSY